MRVACTRLRKEVPEAKQRLTVHDSFIFGIPEGSAPDLVPRIRTIMEDQPWSTTVPITVDAKVGKRWGQMEELPRNGDKPRAS